MPPGHWYPPDLDRITPTFNDSQHRMFWRTKQVLDYVYMMLYIRYFYTDSTYYVQLEDDVLTVPGGYTNFYLKKLQDIHRPWSILRIHVPIGYPVILALYVFLNGQWNSRGKNWCNKIFGIIPLWRAHFLKSYSFTYKYLVA